MFKTLNDKYQKAISDTDDEKLIMESITGSDIDAMIDDPSIEQAAEEEVDVYSVPKQDLDKLDKFADKIVSSADYDDDDLDDMLDSDYDESEIVVAESVSVETPTYDKVGTYNAGIQSGEVDYKMTDCEDRGGVGVNPVIARNNQLSEAVMNMNFELTDVLCEAAAESKGSKLKSIASKIGKALSTALDWAIEQLRRLAAMIAGPFKKMWDAITKKYAELKSKKGGKKAASEPETEPAAAAEGESQEDKIAKARAAAEAKAKAEEEAREFDVYNNVSIVPGIYKDRALMDKAISAAKAADQYASGKLRALRNANASAVAMNKDIENIMKLIREIDYNTEKVKMAYVEAFNLMKGASFVDKDKQAVDTLVSATKKFKNAKGILEQYVSTQKGASEDIRNELDNVDPDDYEGQSKINQRASAKSSAAAGYSAQIRAVNQAVSAITAVTKKLSAINEIHKKNLDTMAVALGMRNSAKGMEVLRRERAKGATNESAAPEMRGNLYTRAYRFVNEQCLGEFQDYFDEATGMYYFGFELEEAAGNATTYEEFKENLKTDGTLKVPEPNFGKKPTSDLSDRDPAQPALKNAVSLAKNTLCQAYTADQLKTIPASKMPTVRKAIAEMVSSKTQAISTLKETYENHMFDDEAVRAAILEDAEAVREDLRNLKRTSAMLESIVGEMDDLDERADRVFNLDSDDSYIDESTDDIDWDSLMEDAEADLDDIDLGDDSDADKKDDDKDSDDKKDEKKSKKSDKDDEECDDEECKDDDKKSEDSKKSDDKKDEDDKDEKKSDKKEEKDDDLDENASLLEAISALMDELD